MAGLVEEQGIVGEVAAQPGAGYVSRQPILDRRGSVFGYELHFHGVQQGGEPGGLSADARSMLDALALFGTERFTSGAWGFVRCDLDVLVEDVFEGLPPALTVLEVPKCAQIGPRLQNGCGRLKDAGFRLALTDCEPGDPRLVLLPELDYVKVDIRTIESQGWDRLCRDLAGTRVLVIADSIHGQEAYRAARNAGLQYFQGFYLCNPVLIPNRTVPADHARQMELLRELFKDPLDLKVLCPMVSRDPSLVYRVLRYANSPLCAVRAPVTSLESAIMILGDAAFRRIATVAIQCTLTQEHSPELLRMALLRARFCAEAASACGLNAEEMYLVGMLSLLPAMLRVPMKTILPGLPLRMEVREALAGAAVKERCLLEWLENLEANNIAGCDGTAEQYGLDRQRLADAYLRALHASAEDRARD